VICVCYFGLEVPEICISLSVIAIVILIGIFNDFYHDDNAYLSFQRVYGDGLTQENLPPASLGDREGSLFVKISPPVYTTESKENAFMQFRLFDAKTNETIDFVTYDIIVTKGANPSSDEEPLSITNGAFNFKSGSD
jgi:hypothetical protein